MTSSLLAPIWQNVENNINETLFDGKVVSADSTKTEGWSFSSTEREENKTTFSLVQNPHTVTFKRPKRHKKQDTMGGSVIYYFSNKKGSNMDLMTLSFQGNSGNLDPDSESGQSAIIALHNLVAISQESDVYQSADGPKENVFSITYVSNFVSTPIVLQGYFPEMVELTEDAKKPNSRNYAFSFVVTKMLGGDPKTIGAYGVWNAENLQAAIKATTPAI